MRHELVFSNRADAEKAQAKITESVLGAKDVQVQSDQAGTIELVFSTDDPLEGWVQRYIIRVTKPAAYNL